MQTALDLTPNHGLSLPIWLRSSPHNDIGLVGKGLALLPRRGEAIGQTTEIIIIVQVSRTGISCSPHVAVLGLELRGLVMSGSTSPNSHPLNARAGASTGWGIFGS
jgi:hypothetical protein